MTPTQLLERHGCKVYKWGLDWFVKRDNKTVSRALSEYIATYKALAYLDLLCCKDFKFIQI